MRQRAQIGSTEWHRAGLAHRKEELETSSWWSAAKSIFPSDATFTHIRCLGLGEISESITARYQLAFLLLLIDHFGVSLANTTLWDPKFSTQDVEILQSYSLAVSEEISDVPEPKTLLYFVPHGPATLNLSLAADPAVVWFLGNDLVNYEPRTPLNPEQTEALSRYRTMVERTKLAVKSSDRWFTAFNDTALQHRLEDNVEE